MKEAEVKRKVEELKRTVWVRRQLALAVNCTLFGFSTFRKVMHITDLNVPMLWPAICNSLSWR